MSTPPPRSKEEIFSSVYKKVTLAEARNLPKYASAIRWMEAEYAEQFESDASSSGSEEGVASVDAPLAEETIWDTPEFRSVADQVRSIEALVGDLTQRSRRLAETLTSHEEQVRSVGLLFADTKKNIEAALVRLDDRKRARVMESQ